MRIDQIEFLKKNLERAAFAMHHVKPYANDKEREKNKIKDGINKIQEALRSITSVGEMFLGMLLDDMKVKDIPNEQTLRPEKPKEEFWEQEYGYKYEKPTIPLCIENLKKMEIRLSDYVLHNRNFSRRTPEEMIYKILEEMRLQNAVLKTALRHLMGETEK